MADQDFTPPAFVPLLNLLATEIQDDNSGRNVLRVFRDIIDPQINTMSNEQLVEAFSEALYALHNTSCLTQLDKSLIAYQVEEKAERKAKELAGAKKGGSANKRNVWADELAKQLKEEYPKCTRDQIWNKLPKSYDDNNPLEIETAEADYKVYRDGNKLVARNTETGEESSITKSTFFRKYFPPMRK